MKNIFILTGIILSFSITGKAQLKSNEWTDKHYEKYTYEKFKKLDVVNQTIDPKNIDYALFKAAIFYCTNIERVKHKKDRFKHSAALEKAAQIS